VSRKSLYILSERLQMIYFLLMAVIKKPDTTDPILRAKLAKGMGHNYYGERAPFHCTSGFPLWFIHKETILLDLDSKSSFGYQVLESRRYQARCEMYTTYIPTKFVAALVLGINQGLGTIRNLIHHNFL
jgi:hypothetical protein